ncbi:hypothetical protein H0H92_010203 [Tricholoma furcatifolium]|nr:hypothetical protein H0H92_010203 [Tricholoma furcatifolium]
MSASLPSYAAIIDAGSTSSRLFIYQWQSEIGLGEPLSLQTVFPSNSAEKKAAEADGGIQHKGKEMAAYLRPALEAGQAFLERRNVTNVPIYLLATGGMRESLTVDEQNIILRAAHGVISDFRSTFSAGRWDTNARVIPGSLEGLYGWVALNYGRGVEEQISGLLELGGASMQIAYKVPKAQASKERVCLLSGEHRVFSKTWDGFGADSTQRRMLAGLLEEAGGLDGTSVIKNPCLPAGQVSLPILGTNRTTVGSGEFSTCLKLAKGVLKDGLATRDAIPSYLDIASFSKHFFGVSNYWYNYKFFSKWGGYDVNRAYDRKAFTDAVTQYCSSSWSTIPWATGDTDRTSVYTLNRCWYTAWMLTLLHDDQYGFGLEMTQYDTWKNVFRFPTTVDLASRSSWTIGAAALVARHGELSLCPRDGSASNPIYNGTLDDVTIPAPLPVVSSSEAACDLAPEPANTNVVNPVASSYTIVAYGLVLVLLAIVGYQRRQIRSSRRTVLTSMREKNVFIA